MNNEINAANILIAIDGNMRQEDIVRVKSIFRQIYDPAEITSIEIGKVEFATTYEETLKTVKTGLYDCLVITDRIRSTIEDKDDNYQQIGIGSIQELMNAVEDVNDSMRIILIVPNERKGGKKLESCFNEGFYNAVYLNDFKNNPGIFIELLLKKRTYQETADYYGLEIEEIIPEEVIQEEIVPEEITQEEIEEYYEPINESERIPEAPISINPISVDKYVREKDDITPEYIFKDFSKENKKDNNMYNNQKQMAFNFEEKPKMEYPPSTFINFQAMGAGTTVTIPCVIGAVLSDNILTLTLPNGGLTVNKESLVGKRVSLLISDV